MNYVTREKVLQGVAEVKEGISFQLSLPLDYPGGATLNPRRTPPRLAATIRDGKSAGKQNFCFPLAEDEADLTDVVSDDRVLLTLQYSTQWDSFAHIGSRFDADADGRREIVFYNGFRAGEHLLPAKGGESQEGWAKYEGTRAQALGIENLAEHGAQGRGVMIDLHHHYGRTRHAVGYDELMKLMDEDRVEVEKGDMVCLYTGFADLILEMRKQPDAKLLHASCSGLDGRDERLLQWVSDCGLAVLASDNYAVEIIPMSVSKPKPAALMPLHEHCLFKNGIHLGEMWYLTELARWLRSHRRSRFLLTAPPLRLPGAVGSPATPVATV
jgi:kynurenine formamidase